MIKIKELDLACVREPNTLYIYNDKKEKHNSFEANLFIEVEGMWIDITGYGVDKDEAMEDMRCKYNNMVSKLSKIVEGGIQE